MKLDPSLALRERVADHLEQQAGALVDGWLETLRRRLRVRDVRLLPTEELRDHMPLVVRGVAEALRIPDQSAVVEVEG